MAMPKTLKTVLIVLLVEVAVGAGVFFFVIFSGVYNVGATAPHFAVTRWVLSNTMDHSVGRHAAGIAVSKTFNAPDLAEGFEHYQEMCETCHGAPGVERSEIGRGLNPQPPELTEAAADWSPAELFWIVKNGIKMSGMPGFGPTHDDTKLWNITAFTKRLPTMSPEQYRNAGKAPAPTTAPDGKKDS